MHLIHLQLTSGKNARRVSLNLTINESGINDEFRENFVTKYKLKLSLSENIKLTDGDHGECFIVRNPSFIWKEEKGTP